MRSLHIGHRFADDRCLWIGHPTMVRFFPFFYINSWFIYL